jgi:hypothetical protein
MYLALLDPDQDKEMKMTKIKLMSFFLRKVPVTRYGLLGTVRHCQKQNFLSNPRQIHSEEEDEEKEEWGSP